MGKAAYMARPWGTILTAALAIVVVVSLSWRLEYEAAGRRHQQERVMTLDRLSAAAARLEGAVLRDVALTAGLSVRLGTAENTNQLDFAHFAQALLKQKTAISHFAAAQDLQVTHLYPVEGNRSILNLDYRSLPDQLPGIQEAIRRAAPVLVGPIDLVQGGKGFIIRMPVAGQRPESGNLISSVIVYDALLKEAGLMEGQGPLSIAIRVKSGIDASDTPFFGTSDIYDENPVLTTVELPAGTWELAGVPDKGWTRASPSNIDFKSLPLTAIFAIFVGTYFKLRRDRERRSSHQTIKQSETRFRSVFENANDGILIVDPLDDRLLRSNQKALDILSAPIGTLISKPFSDLFRAERTTPYQRTFSSADGLKEAGIYRAIFTHPEDGSHVPVELSTTAFDEEEGERLLIHVRDISLRIQYEEALLQAQRDAEQANALKSRFLANFSHEIRTPLNAIVGFSELMQSKIFGSIAPPRYAEYVDAIHSSGQHLLHVINDILDLSRIEAGEMPIKSDWVNLRDVIENCRQISVKTALDRTVDLQVHESKLNCEINADPIRIRQILINLVTNAVKFTPEGGTVTLSGLQRPDGHYVLMVSDTGVGMSKADLENALRPFGQIASKASTDQSGSGLGLTLAKALCDLQKIGFDIDTEPGKGTQVSLIFSAETVRVSDRVATAQNA